MRTGSQPSPELVATGACLVIGVHVNAPTAQFAAIELGRPAAALGLVVGTVLRRCR